MRSFDLEFLLSEIKDESQERKWEMIRNIRNSLLADSDWTQLPDSPVNRKVWAKYRQELRDIPQNYQTAGRVKLPTPPKE